MKWTSSKQLVTKLQEAPKPPVVIPAVPYPEQEGISHGNRYYSTATSQGIIDELVGGYLSFLEQSKDVILTGRENAEVNNLALSITQGISTTYQKAKAIHAWVYQNVEQARTEYIIPPWDLIRPEVKGDCKSFTCLVASLLGVVGIPCWLKLVTIENQALLHIYDFASLTWGVIDAMGAYFAREVKPVSGYIVYEIDHTRTWPPRSLPSGAEIDTPQKATMLIPIATIAAGAAGTIALISLIRGKKEKKR